MLKEPSSKEKMEMLSIEEIDSWIQHYYNEIAELEAKKEELQNAV